MRIENIRLESSGARVRVVGTVIWEDCDHPRRDVYFETTDEFSGYLSTDTDAFLTACVMPAFVQGERRLCVAGEICPVLRDGLFTAMALVSHWYNLRRDPLTLDGKIRSAPSPRAREQHAALFLSGGIDSLATLRGNRLNYPSQHPAAFRDGFLVYGLEIEQPSAFEYLLASLSEFARAVGLRLIPVYTNQRHLDDSWQFWSDLSEAAVFSAIAHAFKQGIHTASLASSYDFPNLFPHASHPLLDPNYSSYDVAIRHDGVAFSRLAKTRLVAAWDVALASVRVCNKSESYQPNRLNCGRCEKCVRTQLALLALGSLDRASSFPRMDLSAEFVATTVTLNPRNFQFYGELVPALRRSGREDLARCVQRKLDYYHGVGWRCRLARFDQRYLYGSLRTLKRLVSR